MNKKVIFLLIIFVAKHSFAQNKSDSSFFKKFDLGVALLLKEKTDSALMYFTEAKKIAEKQNKTSHNSYTSTLTNIGVCYIYQKKPNLAHKFLYDGLLNARTNKHLLEENNSFYYLNLLHNQIVTNNWNFDYPEMNTSYGSYVLFPIEKIEKIDNTDSIRVFVLAGKYDGINDMAYSSRIFKRYDSIYAKQKDVKNGFAISKGIIEKIENNRTILRVKSLSTVPIQEKDLAEIYCQTPVLVKNNYCIDLLNLNINLLDRGKSSELISRRFLLYYHDEKVNFEIVKILKEEATYVQWAYAKDTLDANNILSKKATEGIFKDVNIIKALDSTNTKHIVRFLKFVAAYPGKYYGNSFSFPEVYATWLLNNTPLNPDDILYYIVATDASKRVNVTQALMPQIKQNNLIETWVTRGLNAIDKEDMLETRIVLLGLAAANAAEKKKNDTIAGWANFIHGMYEYKSFDIKTADSLLKTSQINFTKANVKEGIAISTKALIKINANKQVKLQVQDGEIGSYQVVMHPSGKYYATCGFGNKITIWNLSLGKEYATLLTHKDDVTAIAFSPNGRYMASCSKDKTIKIWSTFDYSEINSITTSKTEYCINFSPNNQEIATGGADSLVKIWNINTGKKVKTLAKHKASVVQLCYVAKNENLLFSAGRDSLIYEWDLDSETDIHWYKKKSKLLNMKVSSDGHYLMYTATDTTINVWNLFTKTFYFSQKISCGLYGEIKNYGEPDFSFDGSLLAFPNKNNEIALVDLNEGLFKTISKNASKYSYLNTLNFTPNQHSILATYPISATKKLMDISQYKSMKNFDVDVDVKTFKQYTNPNMIVEFSNDGKSIYVANEKISRFNLNNYTTEPLFYAPQFIIPEKLMVNDSVSFASSNYKTLGFYNHKSRKYESTITLTNNDTIAGYYYDSKNKLFYLVSIHGLVEAHKENNFMIDSTVHYHHQIKMRNNDKLKAVKMDEYSNTIVCFTNDDDDKTIYQLNLTTNKDYSISSPKNFADLAIAKQYYYFNNQDGSITKHEKQTLKIVQSFQQKTASPDAGFIKISPNNNLIAAYTTNTDLLVIDSAMNYKYSTKTHDLYGMGLAFSPNSQYILTGGFDTKMILLNATTGEKLINIYTPSETDFVVADTVGHYFANKNSLQGLNFKLNDKIYPFDQFDLQFNRPDLLLKKTELGDKSLIDAYDKAIEKRLKKSGINPVEDQSFSQIPTLVITDNNDLNLFTFTDNAEITINCFDPKIPLKALHVLVNNNPIYGVAGKIFTQKTRDTIINLKIPLAYGSNAVKIYCTNENNQASLQQTLEVTSSKKDTTAKFWFIGIGVSNYKDKNLTLQYAAKDIRDLTKTFTQNLNKKNVVIDTLLNEKATVANIMALRKKLLKAGVNDKIVVAVTGHGILNKSYDFFYATYDIDVNEPEKKGLAYEMLETLFDSVPAQKKLLLIDACHSGALDKEALLTDTSKTNIVVTKDTSGTVKGFTRSTIKSKKPSRVSLNNTFELMKSMFTDINNNNGSVVISAAGGLEYAFESPTWNNGVFTYAVRKGLEEMEADGEIKFNSKISVNELLKFVSQKVIELTAGKQKPTTRREVLDFDWEL